MVGLVAAVFSYDKIPFLTGKSGYSAYFTEAGGIKPDSDVRVSGLSVGRVSSVKLDGTKVLVSFTVDEDVALGNRTEASIKTETVLGTKMLEITPRGDGSSRADPGGAHSRAVRPPRCVGGLDQYHQRVGHRKTFLGADDVGQHLQGDAT